MSRHPKVMVGYPFGNFEPDFVHSLLRLQKWDFGNRKMLAFDGLEERLDPHRARHAVCEPP